VHSAQTPAMHPGYEVRNTRLEQLGTTKIKFNRSCN
jgi:hypothetical protein